MKTSSKAIFWVMAALAISMLPQLAAMPFHLAVIAVTPLAWRSVAELRGWKAPPAIARVSLAVLVVAIMVLTFGGLLGRRGAVSLLTVMLALKLLETFRIRDARIVASLALFLCATQFLFNQDVPMLFYVIGVIVAALVALALLHRQEAFRPLGEAPASGQSLFSELGFTLKLIALAVPTAFVVFLLFPRWSSPMWGVPEEALDARSGLSGSMSPGSIQGLFMDDSPAFRADFESALPPRSELYWRGPVFWNFDGREWSSMFYSQGLRAESRPDAATAPWRYHIQLEPHEQRWVFALDYPAIVPRGARLSMDYQLRSRRPITSLVSYEMASDPDFIDTPELRPGLRKPALALPADFNPRTWAMMREWREQTPDDLALVQRVLGHFNQQEFYYTLNPPLLSRHTVDEFLFETRSGFCEHYASAFTVMMRMAGIPARVVTGYQGGWFNSLGNYFLVRQSDAHAWSEVWLPDSGWTRVDPTAAVAPERIEGGSLDALTGRRYALDFAWVRDLRNGLDLLQRRWNDWIIAFNADRQSRLFMPFGMETLSKAQLVGLMIGIALLASFMTLPVILRMRLGRRRDPVSRAWQAFRRRLQREGVAIDPGTTASELAVVAGGRMQGDAREIMRIAELYNAIRYADARHLSDEFLSTIRRYRPAAQE